jgi:hypothetical protein
MDATVSPDKSFGNVGWPSETGAARPATVSLVQRDQDSAVNGERNLARA